MNDEQLLSRLLTHTFGTSDLRRRLRVLREYFERLFYSSNTEERFVPSGTRMQFFRQNTLSEDDLTALSLLDDPWFASFSKENMYEKFNNISKYIDKLPTMIIYSPIDLNDEIKIRTASSLRQSISPNLLIDIRLDPFALGGCRIAWKGKYYDISVRYFLRKKSAEIINLFSTYERKQ